VLTPGFRVGCEDEIRLGLVRKKVNGYIRFIGKLGRRGTPSCVDPVFYISLVESGVRVKGLGSVRVGVKRSRKIWHTLLCAEVIGVR
jgi:hypothetical protein